MGVGRRNALHGGELGASVEVSDPSRGIPPGAAKRSTRAGTSRGGAIPRGHEERESRWTAPVRCVRRGWRCTSSGEFAKNDRSGHRMNYARRQQYRRLSRAAAVAASGGVAILVAAALFGAGATSLGGFVLLVALGLGLYSRHWLSLARRSAVGARSEDAVQRAPRAAAGRGLAAASLSAVAGSGRHRLGGDRPDRDRGRDRDQHENVRCAPSRSCARAGGLDVNAPAKVGLQRGARRRVPGSRPERRASRAGRARCLDRPVDGCPSRCGADVFRLGARVWGSRATRDSSS